jgi:hypothetical protein
MKEQNYKNHRQLVPAYHGLTLLLVLAFLIGSIRNFYVNTNDKYNASLLVAAAIIIASLYYFTRAFAIKAQDRAIRAEEQLRYFILTGKRLDQRLTTHQIIALRFASDEEFPSLVSKALDENLRPDDIKKSIRNWRADWYRV